MPLLTIKTGKKLIVCAVFLLLAQIARGDTFPIENFDYHLTENNHSPAVMATGGLNLTNPYGTHTAFNNPALLAFRSTANLSLSLRFYGGDNAEYDHHGLPEKGSFSWYRESLSYFGLDTENIGFSYLSLADLSLSRDVTEDDEIQQRFYADYYLDAYRVSIADKSGQLAFGFNLSLLNGRAVYLHERVSEDEQNYVENFVDSKGLGYSADFGAVANFGTVNYGLMIPNALSSISWKGHSRQQLKRKLQLGVQWGDERNYVVSSISRRFALKSTNVYHLGLQQYFRYGMFRGEEYYIPFRVGIYGESLTKFKDNAFTIGTGYEVSVFQFDVSYVITDINNNNYIVYSSVSVGL